MFFTIRIDFFPHTKELKKVRLAAEVIKLLIKKDSAASKTPQSHIELNENVFFPSPPPHKHYKTLVICPDLIRCFVVNPARLLARVLCIFDLYR